MQEANEECQSINESSLSAKARLHFLKLGVGNKWGFKKLSSSALLEATVSLKRTAEWSEDATGAITLTLDIHLNCLGVNKRSRVLIPLVGENTLWNKSSWWQKSINLV